MTVARNRAIDVLRRATVERRKLRELALLTPDDAHRTTPGQDVVDDRLRLIFTCCHPALAMEARVALTLRTVGGVPTADIARAFLVSESDHDPAADPGQGRGSRQAGIPYRVPTGPALTERLPGVLAVLYLLFTRGYDADGEPAFADEAVRLARLLDRADARPAGGRRAAGAAAVPALPPGRPPRRGRQPAHPRPSRTAPGGTTPPSPRAWPPSIG